MILQRQTLVQHYCDQKSTSVQTTYTNLLSKKNVQNLSFEETTSKKILIGENCDQMQRKQRPLQQSYSGSVNLSSKSSSSLISQLSSEHSFRTFKARYSTLLLPKQHTAKVLNKKYAMKFLNKVSNFQQDSFEMQLKQKTMKGLDFPPWLRTILMVMDLLLTFVLFTISAFQALFAQFTIFQTKKFAAMFINNFCLGFLFVKNIVQCIKTTTHRGKPILGLKDIVKHRLKSFGFWIDQVLIVLLIVKNFYLHSQLIGVLIYLSSVLKMFPLAKYPYVIEKMYFYSYKTQRAWILTKLIIFNILFAHFFTTILLALFYINPADNWMTKSKLSQKTWYQIYVWAFYFAAGIMNSLGFGDMAAATYLEALAIAFLKLTTYTVVILIDIIRMDTIIQLKRYLLKKLGIFRKQAAKDQISLDLKSKIEHYLMLKDKQKYNSTYQQRMSLLAHIPLKLQKKYFCQFINKKIRKLSFFHILSPKTLEQLALRFYDIHYHPQQLIINALSERLHKQKISILKNGTITFEYKKFRSEMNGTVLHRISVESQHRKKGNPLLVTHLFLNKAKTQKFDVRASTVAKILHLDLPDFLQVLQNNQKDKEFFFEVLHRHDIFPHEWCQIKCQFCGKQYHTHFDCPKLHYCPTKQLIILKYIRQQNNNRHIFFHRKRSKLLKKIKWEPFLLVKYFKELQFCLGIPELRKQKQKFKKTLRIAQFEIERLQQSKQQNHPISEPLIVHTSESLESTAFPRSCKVIDMKKLLKKQHQFYPEEYLYKQNREVIRKRGQNSQLRFLKIKLFDLITERLQPQTRGFWDLEIDRLHDFKHYFINFNPQKLVNISVKELTKKCRRKLSNKFASILRL